MIGIDTNILVRYLTQDDEQQANIVNEIFAQHTGIKNAFFINNIVLCELVWVLSRGYKYAKEQIINVLESLLSSDEFAFENKKYLSQALYEYQTHNADFADTLISIINMTKHCTHTISFDEGTEALLGMQLLK